MPFPSEHAARLKDPGLFDQKSFRRVNGKLGPGIDVIFGKLKGGDSMVIQTIRFDAKKFTPAQVRAWLKDHKYSASVEAASGEANKEFEREYLRLKHLAGQHAQKRHGDRGESTGGLWERMVSESAVGKTVPSKPPGKAEIDYRKAISESKPPKEEVTKPSGDKLSTIPKLTSAQLAKPGVKKALQEAQASKRRIDKLQAELDAKIKRLADLQAAIASKKELAASIAIAVATPFVQPRTGSLFITTTKEGQTRWTTLSSSAFRDRDDEIVSTKALLADVERADHDHDYGPLRFWHLVVKDKHGHPVGADIGDCDFNMMHNHILIESGTFRDPFIAETVKENANKLEVSIGFIHPVADPDTDGVYHRIRRFERSLVPKGRVANRTTRLII